MFHPEATFCNLGIYKQGERHRIDAPSLVQGELYSVMFALRENRWGREAAKLPATIREVVPEKVGVHVVKMTMLDQDLQPKLNTWGKFEDGYWLEVGRKITVRDLENGQKHRTSAAYIQSYRDDDEVDLQVLVANELVANMANEIR